MRSYAHFPGQSTGWQQKQSTNESTEWDIRIDVDEVQTPEAIMMMIKASLNRVLYVLVSGVEFADKQREGAKQYGSNGDHVHIALVTNSVVKRAEALQIVRGQRKLTDEYCAPRAKKFLYAGWILHHTKPDYKKDATKQILFEHGTCPMDAINIDNCEKYVYIVKKFGSPDIEPRFDALATMAACLKIEASEENKNKRKRAYLEQKIGQLQKRLRMLEDINE